MRVAVTVTPGSVVSAAPPYGGVWAATGAAMSRMKRKRNKKPDPQVRTGQPARLNGERAAPWPSDPGGRGENALG